MNRPSGRGDDGHWRESVMGNELMTPATQLGESAPLSAITIQTLADLGYRVNVGLADSYSLSSSHIAARIVDVTRAAKRLASFLSVWGM
ncbi:MAG: hypothetical protein F4106_08740 [Gemmatimonadetes bacterium]|nr:hypothetical protein [Gemmatimonadota bacterium]MYC90178.1 hypothetical protein [Gemmatimonadota bacterium]MYJ18116.1 hypothetical protein [Gemmatimonadota bacterium]